MSFGFSWLAAMLGSLAYVLFTSPALAEGRKVLFVAKEATHFSARVRAEIETMGFETIASDVLDKQGRSTAVAAAYVVETPPPRRIELWLLSPASGCLELSTVVQPSENDDDASQTVRASEQLRAFFQPLREAGPAPEAPAAPVPTPATASVPVESPRVEQRHLHRPRPFSLRVHRPSARRQREWSLKQPWPCL